MKSLDLKQMEKVEAGGWASCFGAAVGVASIAALAIAGGPVGWVAWGLAVGRGMSTGFALGDCVYDAVN